MSIVATYGLTKYLPSGLNKYVWDVFLNLGENPAEFIGRFNFEWQALDYLDSMVDSYSGQIGKYRRPMYTIHGK